MGCVEVDTVLMILGVCKRMTPEERDIVTTRMIKGFVGTQQRGLAVAAPVSLPVCCCSPRVVQRHALRQAQAALVAKLSSTLGPSLVVSPHRKLSCAPALTQPGGAHLAACPANQPYRLRAESDMIRPIHGVAGDVIVLTKPLGTQVCRVLRSHVGAAFWLTRHIPTPTHAHVNHRLQ